MIGFSLAKINIGLWVVDKRDDGYHNIESFFYPIKWHDIIEILPAKNGITSINGVMSFFDIPEEENIIRKTWDLLHRAYAIPPVHFYIWKRIPMQAGLGGGSGNAAMTLKMLRDFFYLPLDDCSLREFALNLGSDIPFFLLSRPAFVTGRGEILEPVNLDLSGYKLQVVVPKQLGNNKGISTREAYSFIKPRKREFSLKELISVPLSEWKNVAVNDFEEVVFYRYPRLKKVKQKMYDYGAVFASMSGSGSAIYGIFPENQHLPSWSNDFWVYEE